MELVITAPESWSGLAVTYTINDSDPQELVSSSGTSYELPDELYTALNTNAAVVFKFTDTGTNSDVSVDVTYNANYESEINIGDIIAGNLHIVTVGEMQALKDTVFVNRSNLSDIWNAVVNGVKDYTYSKSDVDARFTEEHTTWSTEEAIDLLFPELVEEEPAEPESSVSENEIWIEADGWDALYSYYDYNTQTWPGSELTKNDQNYYVFDISGITNVSSWLLSDNTSQQTLDLAASLEDMQQYAGKKIRVTAGSNVVSIIE